MSVHTYPFGTEYPPKALDATLQALADLVTSSNTAPYFSDIDQAALMTVTPLARNLLDDTTTAEMQATLGILATPTGEPNAVAFFDDTGALFSESYFAYDTAIGHLGLGVPPGSYQLDVKFDIRAGRNLYVTTYLGIGTTSAYAPLTFSNTLQPKIYLYSSGNSRRGLSTATSEMRLFSDQHLTFGRMSTLDGVTFTETMRLTDTGNLGIGKTNPIESLDTVGAIRLGAAVATNDGTLQYTAGDFQGRKAGAWVSLTGANTAQRVHTVFVNYASGSATLYMGANWPDAAATTIFTYLTIDADYAGGNITYSLLRRAAPGGTAIMQYVCYRLRPNAAYVQLATTTAINFTPTDGTVSVLTTITITGTLQAGDVVRLDLQRDGANAADNLTAGNVELDGLSATYLTYI